MDTEASHFVRPLHLMGKMHSFRASGSLFGARIAWILVTLLQVATGWCDEVKPLREWRGAFPRQEQEVLMKAAPVSGCIASRERWAALWKTWRGDEALPEVDFSTQLILVGTTGCAGNSLGAGFRIDRGGDLSGGFMATQMACPGFAYLILLIDRTGIRSFQGQPIREDAKPMPPGSSGSAGSSGSSGSSTGTKEDPVPGASPDAAPE